MFGDADRDLRPYGSRESLRPVQRGVVESLSDDRDRLRVLHARAQGRSEVVFGRGAQASRSGGDKGEAHLGVSRRWRTEGLTDQALPEAGTLPFIVPPARGPAEQAAARSAQAPPRRD